MIVAAEKWPCERSHLLLAVPLPPPFQFTPTALCTVYPAQPPQEGVLDGISNTSITKGMETAYCMKPLRKRADRSLCTVIILRPLGHRLLCVILTERIQSLLSSCAERVMKEGLCVYWETLLIFCTAVRENVFWAPPITHTHTHIPTHIYLQSVTKV